MSDTPPPIERHAATERFGKAALRTAHRLSVAMAESGSAGEEPILVRAGGPHRTLDGVAALIDAALADEGAGAEGARKVDPVGLEAGPAGRSRMTAHPLGWPHPLSLTGASGPVRHDRHGAPPASTPSPGSAAASGQPRTTKEMRGHG